jgi:hypothetical protein
MLVQLLVLVQGILVRLPGEIGESLDRLWSIVNEGFSVSSRKAVWLTALAALGRAAGSRFVAELNRTAVILLEGLGQFEGENCVAEAAVGVSLLCDEFDMQPFCEGYLKALTRAMEHEGIPIEAKRFVAEAIQALAHNCNSEFSALSFGVLPPLIRVGDSLGDLVESLSNDECETDVDPIIVSFLGALMTGGRVLIDVGSENSGLAIEGLVGLLETIGGMKEHGDALLRASVKAILFLIESMPDRAIGFLSDEIGLEVLVRETSEAGLMSDAIEQIVQYMNAHQE